MDYYSAIKEREILSFATTQMNLEGIMLSEISKTKTDTIWSHLYVGCKKQNKWKNNSQIQKTDLWLSEGCGDWRVGKMGEEGQDVQTSSYKINKSWECNVQCGNCSPKHYSAYFKIVKRVNFKSSHHKKNIFLTSSGDRW